MKLIDNVENKCIQELINLSLEEDLLPNGDLSAFLLDDSLATANILAKEDGLMACSFIVEQVLVCGLQFFIDRRYFDLETTHLENLKIDVKQFFKDSNEFKAGDILFEITAPAALLLALERTILNFLQRLCGVATTTKKLLSNFQDTETKLLDTRKTSPGMRFLEKQAFKAAGATNHRLNLSDMLMIKENHIALSRFENIIEAIAAAHQKIREEKLEDHRGNRIKIEVEINQDNKKLLEAIFEQALVDIVMLDNFSIAEIKDLMLEIDGLKNKYSGAQNIKIEASGGINLENIEDYAKLGLDYISSAYVSKNSKNIDLSMLVR
jgi:nicotinate-nucleotide pyrophosphorylase (carboxylating)